MTGPTQAFLGRQPILDRGGELMGYELLYRASAAENVARFDNEDEASLEVLGTLLGDLGASQVLAGKQAVQTSPLMVCRCRHRQWESM